MSACSGTQTEDPMPLVPSEAEDVMLYAPEVLLPEGEGIVPTRGSYYDGVKEGVYFDWVAYDKENQTGDVAGIVPITDGAQQLRFECKSVSTTAEDAPDGVSRALFRREEADFAWNPALTYRAYSPYTSLATDVTAIALDYTGQQQTGKPNMADYFDENSNHAAYYATERSASAHLTAKTFLLSAPATPSSENALRFKMNHLGGILRFYLAMPASTNIDVTEVRLVATKAVFHESASLNIQSGTTTPTGEATNSLILKTNAVRLDGSDVYDHYLVAYMMAYPVALTSNDVLGANGKLYIYAKGNDGTKDVYFRSGSITKKDIVAGQLTQFSVKPTEKDEPIDVQPITVQEWQAGLTLNNDGNGTESW